MTKKEYEAFVQHLVAQMREDKAFYRDRMFSLD